MSLPQTYKTLRSQGKDKAPIVEQLPLPKPGKNEVLIKMAFAPINPVDIHTIHGAYGPGPAPSLVGLEGSGTIVAVGQDLKVPRQVGDKVSVLAIDPNAAHRFGTFGEYVIISAETCQKIPEGLSMEEASCPYVNPSTAYYMFTIAQRGGHKAVIQDVAASQVGRMLIRLLKSSGIKSINIVRRAESIEELKKEGADYVLNSQDPDFETKLKEIATKEKATLSFDAIGGDVPSTLLKNQSPGSICYVYGMLSGRTVKEIQIGDLMQRKKVAGFVCVEHMIERNEKGDVQNYFKEMTDLLPTAFKTNIQKVFKFEELKEAIEYAEKNASQGKVLLRFD